MDTFEWPTEVPVLTASDIHKGSLESNDGKRCCLIGWSRRTFGPYAIYRTPLGDVLLEASADEGRHYVEASADEGRHYDDELADFNDRRSVSKATIARVWNLAMARLGYVVGNPEAKNVRRRTRKAVSS